MSIKAIVVDLDRTLLRTDKSLSPYTISTLRECKSRGIRIMVATARPLRTTVQFDRVVGFDAMTVSNGARVLCGKQRIEYGIRTESAHRVLQTLLGQKELKITLETGDCAYSNMPIEDYETILSNDLCKIAEREGALKILAHVDGGLNAISSHLPDDLYFTVAHGYLLQIMSREATKWNGIQTMLKRSNLSAEEAVYFGDDQDDIEPLRHCGIGVSVANGIDEAKAAADYVTGSNDEDGVAKFIQRILLKNQGE